MLFAMPQILRRILIVGAILVVVGAVGGVLRNQLGIAFDVESVRAFAEGLGPSAPFLFILVVAGRSLLWLPSQVVLVAAGLCFGTLVGALVGGAGLMLSGVFAFSVARYTGRDAIAKRIGKRGERLLELASRRTGAVAFGLACGYPVSPLIVLQTAAGLTPMSFPNFVLAAFIGGGIRAAVFAYFGNALLDPSAGALITATAIFLVAIAIPFAFPSGRAWLKALYGPLPDSSSPEEETPSPEDS